MKSSQANGEFRSRPVWRTGAVALGAVLGLPAVASAATSAPAGPAAAQAAAAAHATLALKSRTALPYQAVGFTAAGFKGGERVTLHWGDADGAALATVTAGKSGKLSGTFHVPLPRGGVTARVELTAVGRSSRRQAVATFTQGCTDEWTHLAGSGTCEFLGSGTISGTIPASQTVTVNADIALTLDGNLTNRGTLVLTSTDDSSGGNAALTPTHTAVTGPTLFNYGRLLTQQGTGGARDIGVSVNNEKTSAADLAASTSQLAGGLTFVNSGTLNIGAAAGLDLIGDSDGPSSLVDKPTATTNITINTASGDHSTIDQPVCSKAACMSETIELAGTLNVAKAGRGKVGLFVPVVSMQHKIIGTFAHKPSGIGASCNGPGSGIPNTWATWS